MGQLPVFVCPSSAKNAINTSQNQHFIFFFFYRRGRDDSSSLDITHVHYNRSTNHSHQSPIFFIVKTRTTSYCLFLSSFPWPYENCHRVQVRWEERFFKYGHCNENSSTLTLNSAMWVCSIETTNVWWISHKRALESSSILSMLWYENHKIYIMFEVM